MLIENNTRGGISSVIGDGYIKSDDNKILYIDAINLYGYSMSQALPFDEIEMWHGHPDLYMKKLEETLNISDDSDIGYFVEVDLKYPDKIKQKTKNFPFAPENKLCNEKDFSDYMKKIKPDKYTQNKKLICDWTDEKKYLFHYSMLKFFVRHGIIVEEIHEIISFKQSKCLEKHISFNKQKPNRSKKDFEKDFYELLINAIFGNMLENIRNRLKRIY